MKKVHFYAYGRIGEADPLFKVFTGEDDPVISSQKVVDFLSSNQDADEIIVHINSRGGSVDEGFAIHDLLQTSGKKITTVVEGQAYSIASVVALSGSVRQITENSKIGIHNPWIDPTIIAGLEADELLKMGNDMKREENRIAEFYSKVTGVDMSSISEMMAEDTAMNADKALELKFVTEIIKPVKALAYMNFKSEKENTMSKEIKTLGQKVDALADSIMNFLSGKTKEIKMEESAPVVAETEAPVEEAVVETPVINAEEFDALKKENEELKAKLAEHDSQMEKLNIKFNEIAKNIQSSHQVKTGDTKFNRQEEKIEKALTKADMDARKEKYKSKNLN